MPYKRVVPYKKEWMVEIVENPEDEVNPKQGIIYGPVDACAACCSILNKPCAPNCTIHDKCQALIKKYQHQHKRRINESKKNPHK